VKIGDMVIRAYTWKDIVPGIIVEEEIENVEDEGFNRYQQLNLIVQWSDGSMTRELDCELEYMDEVFRRMEECKHVTP